MKTKFIFLLLFAFLFIACPIPPPPPQPPVPPVPPEPPIPPIEYVRVDTCKDSGEMRNTHCPDGRIAFGKKYVKGTEPLTWCSFHKKPAPPIPDPKPPYNKVASFYQLLISTPEEIVEFIGRLHEHGASGTEIFLNFVWPLAKSSPWKSYPTSGWKFSLYEQVGTWSEPKFGDYKFPTFDLDKFREESWDKLQLIMEECKKNGIALFMRIGDYCSLKEPFYKRHYPYNNGSNIQNYTGGNYGEPIRKWYKRFNRKLMQTIVKADLKHYFIIPMNEADVIGDDSNEWKDKALREFHQFYIDDFRSRGVKKNQIILNIHRENPRKHFAGLKYRIQYHWINSLKALQERIDKSGTYIFANGDGPDPYGLGIKSFNGNHEPSYEQGKQMGQILGGQPDVWYGYYLRSTEQKKGKESVELANFIALDGIVKGLKSPRPPPPPPPPPIDKKLSVSDGKIYYGDEPITLIGVSRWEALWREYGEHGWHDWGEYSLEWYEKQLIDSGINYVRHGGIQNFDYLYSHCERMRDAGIIVEVTVYRVGEPDGILVDLDRMGELAELGNVFFDVCNEFIGNDNTEIQTVIDIANNLKSQGCIVSAGAWSGDDGKAMSDLFYTRYSGHDIATHHREWAADSFNETLARGKPSLFNEFFAMREQLGLQDVQDLMNLVLTEGFSGVTYYGVRFAIPGITNLDPWQPQNGFNKAMVNYAGQLAKSLNR